MRGYNYFFLLLSVLAIIGCADEKKKQKVARIFPEESKGVLSTDVDYLYVPNVLSSPRSVSASRPQWVGDGKRVRFEFAEHSIKVKEVEADPRFSDNPNNFKPVLEIPIDHVDYTCSEDAYGRCTNKEELNEKVGWKDRRFFRPKFNELNLQEVNFLPIDLMNLVFTCHQELTSEFVDYKFEKDALNFQIDKTYKSNILCASGIESLSDLSFTVRNQYSFVKLSSVASSGYVPFKYDRSEEGQFGFFTTLEHKLDVDNNDVEESEVQFLNRWSPNKVVNYYLNEPFNKPANKKVKEATYQAFDVLNESLKKAGSGLTLKLNEPDPSVQPGDIRHSMVVMVEDPQAINVIGYGPSIADPRTGEIVHAKTVMYLGTIKKYIKYNYDEVLEDFLQKKVQKNGSPDKFKIQMAQNKIALTDLSPNHTTQEGSAFMPISATDTKATSPISVLIEDGQVDVDFSPGLGGRLPNAIERAATHPQYLIENQKRLSEQIEILSNHNAYPAELFNFEEVLDEEIEKLIADLNFRPWQDLSSSEKERVLNTLVPFVWVPTLIHEVGHNLGLRHNFAGSEDKDNFYTDEELAQMGVKRKFNYSSVMDYAYRTTNELRVMGKYDVAALRYAYAEKVETVSGDLISVSEMRANPSLELKPYDFCTDEHASVNPNCNRFDEGTDMVEIVSHLIQSYHDRYKRANFRNKRRNFSLYHDYNQLAYLYDHFGTMRLVFERYERIKNDYGLDDSDELWEKIDFLKQLKNATLLSGLFFVDVLKTPDILCAVSKRSKPETIIGVVPLKAISVNAIDCFDGENVALKPEYLIVGQGGKSFSSRKSPFSNNPYIDQVDIRGIWLDKMLATQFLFARSLGSPLFDKYTDNFLHVPELRNLLTKTVENIVEDDLTGTVYFGTPEGDQFQVKLAYSLFETHAMDVPLDERLQEAFKLPSAPSNFLREFTQTLGRELPSIQHEDMQSDLMASLRVHHLPVGASPSASDFRLYRIGDTDFVAYPENKIARNAIQNLKALDLFERRGEVGLKELLKALEDPNSQDPDLALGKDLGADRLKAVLAGELKGRTFYTQLLRSLL